MSSPFFFATFLLLLIISRGKVTNKIRTDKIIGHKKGNTFIDCQVKWSEFNTSISFILEWSRGAECEKMGVMRGKRSSLVTRIVLVDDEDSPR